MIGAVTIIDRTHIMPVSPQYPVSFKWNVKIIGYELINFSDERRGSRNNLIT